ncbi:helicase associated domain-containing protein [Sulfitobacter sp. TBRI5]|uniref:helicase associated domain-containing protein n=1 Tax=Sulfitobacter sp. TBRI5 TaxID=2989732 RepID=UPI003D9B7B9A
MCADQAFWACCAEFRAYEARTERDFWSHGGVDPGFGLIDKWPENKQLGTWVGTQRKNAKKGTLSEEGRQRLESVGFRF